MPQTPSPELHEALLLFPAGDVFSCISAPAGTCSVDEGHLIHSGKGEHCWKNTAPLPSRGGEGRCLLTLQNRAGVSILTFHGSGEESSRKSWSRLRKYGDGSTLLISGSSFLPLEAFSVVKIHPRHVFYGDQDNPLQGQEWLTMQYKALGKETSKYSLKLFT